MAGACLHGFVGWRRPLIFVLPFDPATPLDVEFVGPSHVAIPADQGNVAILGRESPTLIYPLDLDVVEGGAGPKIDLEVVDGGYQGFNLFGGHRSTDDVLAAGDLNYDAKLVLMSKCVVLVLAINSPSIQKKGKRDPKNKRKSLGCKT